MSEEKTGRQKIPPGNGRGRRNEPRRPAKARRRSLQGRHRLALARSKKRYPRAQRPCSPEILRWREGTPEAFERSREGKGRRVTTATEFGPRCLVEKVAVVSRGNWGEGRGSRSTSPGASSDTRRKDFPLPKRGSGTSGDVYPDEDQGGSGPEEGPCSQKGGTRTGTQKEGSCALRSPSEEGS